MYKVMANWYVKLKNFSHKLQTIPRMNSDSDLGTFPVGQTVARPHTHFKTHLRRACCLYVSTLSHHL